MRIIRWNVGMERVGCERVCWGIQGYSVNPKAEFEKGHVYSLLKLIQILVRGPVHWITDPDSDPDSDPAIFFSGSQDAIKKSFFYYLLYCTDNKLLRRVNTTKSRFLLFFGRIRIRTNDYGSGIGSPKKGSGTLLLSARIIQYGSCCTLYYTCR